MPVFSLSLSSLVVSLQSNNLIGSDPESYGFLLFCNLTWNLTLHAFYHTHRNYFDIRKHGRNIYCYLSQQREPSKFMQNHYFPMFFPVIRYAMMPMFTLRYETKTLNISHSLKIPPHKNVF